jgi:hypothetical protein
VLHHDNPMTVRQVFYQLVSLGAIDKTEVEYKQTVVRLLTEMRRTHELPFVWIADNTRWMRKPRTYDSLEDALEITKQTYRRGIWSDQESYVEIWAHQASTLQLRQQRARQEPVKAFKNCFVIDHQVILEVSTGGCARRSELGRAYRSRTS